MRGFLLGNSLKENMEVIELTRGLPTRFDHFRTVADFFTALSAERPSMIILDWRGVEMSALQILRRSRELCGTMVPIALLSHEDDDKTIVAALQSGADDYLLKDKSKHVLSARLESLLRRSIQTSSRPQHVVEIGPLKLDYQTQTALVEGTRVILTPKEFDLAWVLLVNPERFISKTELIARVWGKSVDIVAHTISQHMYAVRKKLCFARFDFRLVSIYGSGYRLDLPQPAPPRAARPSSPDSGVWLVQDDAPSFFWHWNKLLRRSVDDWSDSDE